jgi:P4 family phage/plasmid primase-like protien
MEVRECILKGNGSIAGKVLHRQDKKDYYFTVLDADKIEAIKEICTRNGKTISLQDMAQKTLVEQHKDCLDRAHICFYSPILFPKKGADSVLGLEVKGLMFCSPSLHKNGHPYEIMGTAEPVFLTVQQATELLQHIDQICIKYGLRYLESNDSVLNDKIRKMVKSFVIDKTVVIPEGIWHSTLISIANSILFRQLGRKNNDGLKEFFMHINDALCRPEPLPEREIMSIWKSALEFVAKNKKEGPLETQYTEEEEQSTVEQLAEEIMYKYKIKTLMDTEEMVYYKDGIYRVGGEQLIKIGLEEIAGYSMKINKRNEIIAHIKYRTMVNREDFDNDIDIINVRNGLLNIMTGELRPHTPEYLSFVQLPVRFDPNSICQKIIKFLSQVLSKEDISTIVRVFGYCLYRSAPYEKAVMLIGPGRNGKSVLIKLVEALIGHENVSHASLQELLGDRFASADLYCKLVNAYADLEADKLINTGKFKTLVSGDSIRAQKKHQQAFSFRNYAKLIFSTNKIPESEDKSYAYYRRWVILSFNRVFEGEDEDTGLIHKLTTDEHELAGLLNLALIGLKKLIKEGGFKDVSVEKIKQQYEHNASIVRHFIDEQCVVDLNNSEYSVSTLVLVLWCS